MICNCSKSDSAAGAWAQPTCCQESVETTRERDPRSVGNRVERRDRVRSRRTWSSGLFLIWLAVISIVISGCGTADETGSDEPPTMMFVDVKTGEARALPATAEVPVVNPDTGQRTMMPAMYCETCEKWYPVPPAEQLNRAQGAGMCPKHKTPLKAVGPRP